MITTLTETDEYLEVATGDELRRITLTLSRRGEKCRARGVDRSVARQALASFGELLGRRDGRSERAKVRAVKAYAEATATLREFVAGIYLL